MHLQQDLTNPLYQPENIVYLDACVETCYNRIKARSRKGEEKLDAAALACLKLSFDQWIARVAGGTGEPRMCKNIIYINGDGDHVRFMSVIREVHGRLKELFPTHLDEEPDTAFNSRAKYRSEE